MNKDRLKSLLLVILILNSVILTISIWFNEKLWPSGYNFFVTLKNNPVLSVVSKIVPDWLGGEKKIESSFQDIYTPRLLVVKSGSHRTQFLSMDSQFQSLYPEITSALKNLYIPSNMHSSSACEKAEWINALKGKSIYMDFGLPVSTRLYGHFLTGKEGELSSIPAFSKIIISLQSSNDSELVVFVNQNETDSYRKFTLSCNKAALSSMLDSLVMENSPSYKFAFELRLDAINKEDNSNVLRRVTPSSLVILPQQDIAVPNLYARPVLGEKNEATISEILKIFKYNTLAYRKLEDAESNVLYVENFSTLKFTSNNFLEYKAVDSESGLILKNTPDVSLSQQYEIISYATAFVGELWNTLYSGSPNMELRLSSPLIENASGKYTLTFDYYHNGIPIKLMDDSAITLQIENGRLVSYTQSLLTFEKQEGVIEANPVLWAIDEFYKIYSVESGENSDKLITINDVFLRYTHSNGGINANWSIKTDESKTYTIKNN